MTGYRLSLSSSKDIENLCLFIKNINKYIEDYCRLPQWQTSVVVYVKYICIVLAHTYFIYLHTISTSQPRSAK